MNINLVIPLVKPLDPLTFVYLKFKVFVVNHEFYYYVLQQGCLCNYNE